MVDFIVTMFEAMHIQLSSDYINGFVLLPRRLTWKSVWYVFVIVIIIIFVANQSNGAYPQ